LLFHKLENKEFGFTTTSNLLFCFHVGFKGFLAFWVRAAALICRAAGREGGQSHPTMFLCRPLHSWFRESHLAVS
jgi:hypothetical protein